MIVNATDMLKKAKKEKYAVAHFNINNLEWTRFILEECNELNSSVILGVSESALAYMGGYKLVVDIVTDLVKELNITIPVVIHLDHASSFESCKKAIDNGFTSVMIDASIYELEKNIEITKKVVEYAHKKNVSVEAELGHVGTTGDEINEANIEDVVYFVKETNIDSLAPAIGNIHGVYVDEIKLNYDKLKNITKKTDIPLVLHGASGIGDEDLKKLIKFGICKININTDLQIAWSKAVRRFLCKDNSYDPRMIIKSGEKDLKEVVKNRLEIFGSFGR